MADYNSGNFINPDYATPEQVAQMRAMSNQLLTGATQPTATSWTGALAQALMGLRSGQQLGQANQLQRQLLQQGQQGMVNAGQNNPVVNMLLGGGVPQGQQPPMVQGQQTPAPAGGQASMQTGVPRGIRNNNPGNIEDGAFARSIPGYAGSDGRFAIFNSPQAGQQAMDQLLTSYGQKGINTPQAIASRWAPAGDGNNNPMAYASTVAGQMGVQPNTQLNMNDPNVRQALAAGMTRMENGAQPGQSPTQPPMQMAQSAPGEQSSMAALFMNPSVPQKFKDAAMAGQVPGTIQDAQGNVYLYKPGMSEPVFLMHGVGPQIKVPGYEGPVNAGMGGPQQGQQPPQPNIPASANPMPQAGGPQALADWGMRNAANLKGQESEASKIGEALPGYVQGGIEANQLAGNLDTLKQLGSKVGYGLGPEIQKYLASKGLYTPGISDIQAYQNFIPYVSVLLRPEGSGRLMTQELQQFQQALGGLMITPEGRATAVESLSRIAHYKADVAKIASDYSLSQQDRLQKINNLPVPQINWSEINKAAAAGKTGPQIDPDALTEARKRGLIK